jgi:hypothetical protein
MSIEIASTENQMAMIQCLQKAGWDGDVEALSGDARGRIRLQGELLSTFLAARGPLDYTAAVDMLHCIGMQIQALTALGRGMPAIETEDVIILDKGWYLLTGLHRSWENDCDGRLVCRVPPLARLGAKPGTLGGNCLPPELQGSLSLPLSCTHAATNYSLCMMVRESLGLGGTLSSLSGSPLYYCLKRCLVLEPKDRRMVFI